MNLKTNFRLTVLTLFVITLFSCENEPLDLKENTKNNTETNDFTILGEKKEIPFTVENMQKAYNSLLNNPTASKHPRDKNYLKSDNARVSGNYQITTTHHYVKFHPQDSTQYFKISNDSILSVSDVPFEYNIQFNGERYQDPSLANTDFTYYYAVVPVNYQLPNDVPNETLANLHFTKEDLIEENASEAELELVDFYHDLNTETLKLTNNLEAEKEELRYLFINNQGFEEKLTWQETQAIGLNLNQVIINFDENDYENPNFFERRSKWNPFGVITVHEDVIGQNIGVAGARVKVRKWGWLVIRKAYTYPNGFFITSGTRTKRVKYAVYFKNSTRRFKVKAGTIFWDARDRGHATHKRKPWIRHYTPGKRDHFYALVHNAAFDYYNRAVNTFGLKKPNQSWLRINAKFNWKISDSYHLDINPNGQVPFALPLSLFSEIKVGRKNGNGVYAGSDRIFGTVNHEMTHASHYRLDRSFFLNVFNPCERKTIRESWAEGAETILTNHRYNELSPNYISTQAQLNNDLITFGLTGHNDNKQIETNNNIDEYTPIVIDLIDNFNQNNATDFIYAGNQPVDNVFGYNLAQIQSALKTTRGLHGWKERIKNINGNDNDAIEELFNEYIFNICD